MPQPTNKLSQFWQELKRRKVIKAIAMYAGGAYVLIELANNVVAPLNLPDWTPRLVIIIALVGFPIMVVLSWIFDITPEGIGKTESLEELKEQETPPSPVKRSLKLSDVIIGVLVIVVAILAYPRLFGTPRLNAMTFPVTVVNEFGEKETRRVIKEKYITRLALFPFIDESKDSSYSWLRFGIMDAIMEDQYQYSNVLIDWNSATRLNEQITHANSIKYPYFLTGAYHASEGEYTITSRLYQTSNGALLEERDYKGYDFFSLLDSLCAQARRDLSISEVILNSTPDLSISELMTAHLEAYAIYVEGRYNVQFDGYYGMYSPFYKAIELDSTFAAALLTLAHSNYNYKANHESAVKDINQAMRHRGRLSEIKEIYTRILYYLIQGDTKSVIALTDRQYELRPYDFNLMSLLLQIYDRLHLVDRMERTALRMNELVPGHPPYQMKLADCYLISGKFDKGLKVLNVVLEENPDHEEALLKKGEIYLHKNDLEKADESFNQAIILMPEEDIHVSKLLDHIAYAREKKDFSKLLESLAGEYRNEFLEVNGFGRIIRNQFYVNNSNQSGLFFYPVSDTVLVSVHKEFDGYYLLQFTGVRNKHNELIKVFGQQWSPSGYLSLFPAWREDSLIIGAKEVLESGRASDALSAFRRAYNQHPEHYYLANFIQHLEFVESPEYESWKFTVNELAGEYGDVKLHIEDGQFYYTNNEGLIYKLLPLVADRFMTPSIYALDIHIIREGREVTGMKFVYRDGREEFYPRATGPILTSQNQ